jgi:phosphoglycolate phosphatase
VREPLARPRALLFDWDNTLVDTWGPIHRALAATLEALGERPWSFDETKARVRSSAREAFPSLFGRRARKAEAVFYRFFEAEHLRTLKELPGAGAMLAELADAGFYLAVVSNKTGRYLRAEAEHLGWDGYFARVVGAGDAPRDKPAADAVTLALGDHVPAGGGNPSAPDVWFVGDTDVDMRCAVNAGCVPLLLRAEPPGQGEFAAAPPRLHLRDCGELAALLRRL